MGRRRGREQEKGEGRKRQKDRKTEDRKTEGMVGRREKQNKQPTQSNNLPTKIIQIQIIFIIPKRILNLLSSN